MPKVELDCWWLRDHIQADQLFSFNLFQMQNILYMKNVLVYLCLGAFRRLQKGHVKIKGLTKGLKAWIQKMHQQYHDVCGMMCVSISLSLLSNVSENDFRDYSICDSWGATAAYHHLYS